MIQRQNLANSEQLKSRKPERINNQQENLLAPSIASHIDPKKPWKRLADPWKQDKFGILLGLSIPLCFPAGGATFLATTQKDKKVTAGEKWLKFLRYVLKIGKRVAVLLQQANFWLHWVLNFFTPFFKGGSYLLLMRPRVALSHLFLRMYLLIKAIKAMALPIKSVHLMPLVALEEGIFFCAKFLRNITSGMTK